MKPSNTDLAIASASTIAYTALLTLGYLDENEPFMFCITLVAAIWLYACYAIDREQKHRQKLRDAQREALTQALDELEAWRESREAD